MTKLVIPTGMLSPEIKKIMEDIPLTPPPIIWLGIRNADHPNVYKNIPKVMTMYDIIVFFLLCVMFIIVSF